MKNYILIAIVALLGFSSCKKTIIINNEVVKELPSATKPIEVKTGENYTHTDEFIRFNSWKIVTRYDSNVNGEVGEWKLQQSNGSNNFLLISPAPPHKYWKAEYNIGRVIEGHEVITMSIKTFTQTKSSTDPARCTCGRLLNHAPVPATGIETGCNGGWMDDGL